MCYWYCRSVFFAEIEIGNLEIVIIGTESNYIRNVIGIQRIAGPVISIAGRTTGYRDIYPSVGCPVAGHIKNGILFDYNGRRFDNR